MSTSPAIERRIVVFPHPDGPRSVTKLPLAMLSEKSRTATNLPYEMSILLNSTAACCREWSPRTSGASSPARIAPAATGRGICDVLSRLSRTFGDPIPLLGPGVFVLRPVDRVGEGQRLHRSGRVVGRQRLDLLGHFHLGRIERRGIVL